MAVNVDFTGVEGGRRNCQDGEYILEVIEIEEKKSGEGNPYLAWKWKIAEGEHKGVTVYDNTSLQPQALWRLKGLLECLGVDTSGKLKMDPKRYLKKKLKAQLLNETYQGKTRPRISEFIGPATAGGAGSDAKYPKGTKVNVEDGSDIHVGTVIGFTSTGVVVSIASEDGTEEWEVTESDLSPFDGPVSTVGDAEQADS